MKIYIICFQPISNGRCVNSAVQYFFDFANKENSVILLTSYVDRYYGSNIKGHGKFVFFLFKGIDFILRILNISYGITRTVQELIIDYFHSLILKKEKEPYVLINTMYSIQSTKVTSQKGNKVVLFAVNLNDELYYKVDKEEKKRLGLNYVGGYDCDYRIKQYRKMMCYIDEVWCASRLAAWSFEPHKTVILQSSYSKRDFKLKGYDLDNISSNLILGYIGHTLSPLKGVHILVDAISKSKYKGDIKLIIVGNVNPFYKDYLLRSDIDIEFKGFVEELEQAIKSFDYLVVPSIYDAGPTTIYEGLWCNVPVIASDGCGGAEYIKNNPVCFVFKTKDVADLTAKIDYIFENKKYLFSEIVKLQKIDVGNKNNQGIKFEDLIEKIIKS